MSRPGKSQGFTLIELMVALGLGLLVAAAATQLFITNLKGFNLQRGISDVQDNGRFALDLINRDVRQGGLTVNTAMAAPVPTVVLDTSSMPGATAQLLTTNSATSIGLGSSDQLVIQRLAMADTVDCEGNTVLQGQYIVSRYFLRADAASGSTSALACDGGYRDGSALSGMGDAGIVLLGSVESFQVQLGTGASGVPTRYQRSDEVVLAPVPVLAVRVGMLVSSADRTGDQVGGAAPTFNVLDTAINNAPADGRIRRVFVTSIALRNAL